MLDLLSDIGGVQGIFQSFFSLLVGVLNYDYLNDSLVSKLYKFKPKNGKRLKNQSHVADLDSLKTDSTDAELLVPTKCCRIKFWCSSKFKWCFGKAICCTS